MTKYKDEGSINTNFFIEEKNEYGNEKKIEEDIFNIDYELKEGLPIYIETQDELLKNMFNILNGYYVSIYRDEERIYIINENGKIYSINLDNIDKEDIKRIFIYKKPRKICFDLTNFVDFLECDSDEIIDVKLMFKLMYNVSLQSEKQVFEFINAPEDILDSTYLMYFNMIKVVKELNINIERRRLNYYSNLELYVLKLATCCNKYGFPVDGKKYEEFMKKLRDKYSIIVNQSNFKYDNKQSLLNYLSENGKYLSLNETLLKDEDYELYKNLLVFNTFKEYEKANYSDGKLFIEYDTYDLNSFNIKSQVKPNGYYYLDQNYLIVQGRYEDLYYKIFAELSRDKTLMEEASYGNLIDFIKNLIFGSSKDKKLEVIIQMCLNGYTNNYFEAKEMQKFLLNEFDTVFDINDINHINENFNDKLSTMIDFIKNFDGNSDEYARYRGKIFYPSTNLHCYIKQIENLIFKTAVFYVSKSIEDFNDKYNKEGLKIAGLYDDSIVILAKEENYSIAVDILNRYMAYAYKKYIKKTKYFNKTYIAQKS